ncbi:hypothetical protein ACEWY4_014843 [Coilia grayii]|uniref:Uncharacterized protein n=1 Tax=Coilia grayii TaxID=363190 RepID=A0ABD1JTM3_9TELE
MKLCVVFVLLSVFWALVVADDKKSTSTETIVKTTSKTTTSKSVVVTTVTHKNGTRLSSDQKSKGFDMDSSMIQRALYVLTGITILGILVKVVRRKKTTVTQRKKYGLLSNQDNMEMASLESDEDDTTLYEARTLRR